MHIDLSQLYSCFSQAFLEPAKYTGRYLIMVGGRGSGKSHSAALKIIARCLLSPPERILCVRKYKTTLRNSVIKQLQEVLSLYNLTPAFRITRDNITCHNGSEIIWAGLDDPEKLKSTAGVTSIWVEEASEISQLEFEQGIDPLLRGNTPSYKQIIFTLNPMSKKLWIRTYFDSKENAQTHHSTYKDNRYIDADYGQMLEALRKTNPILHAVFAKGEWGELIGQILQYDTAYKDMPPSYYGMDFGWTDPTALVEIAQQDQDIYAKELLYAQHLNDESLLERLDNLSINKELPIFCDSASPEKIDALIQGGYNAIACEKGRGSVSRQLMFLQNYNMHIDPNSHNLIAELDDYIWDDKANKDKPAESEEHLISGIRYAIFTNNSNRGSGITTVEDW